MRSALAKVQGVDASNIAIDDTAKTATITLAGGISEELVQALIGALEGTKFSATVKA